MTDHPVGPARRKRELRAALLAARAQRTPAQLAQAEAAIAAGALALCLERRASTVAGYVSAKGEPPTGALLSALEQAGIRVLLPVVAPGHGLDWALAGEKWRTGAFGLSEPDAPGQGALALGAAQVAFVPALAVDRAGHRLGRGGGYIDRALHLARPALVLAVVYDEECLDELPATSTDATVDGWLTASGVVVLPE